MSYPLKFKHNFCMRYYNGNQNLNGSVDYAQYNTTQIINTNLYATFFGNEGVQVLVAGYYRVVCNTAIEQFGHTGRSVIRGALLKQNVYSNPNGQSYCYIRHKDYGSFGAINIETILLCSANDIMKLEYRLDKDSGSSFGDNFSSQYKAVSQRMILEYLGD